MKVAVTVRVRLYLVLAIKGGEEGGLVLLEQGGVLGWQVLVSPMLVGAMLRQSIFNVQVHAFSACRFFIVPIDVLCQNVAK